MLSNIRKHIDNLITDWWCYAKFYDEKPVEVHIQHKGHAGAVIVEFKKDGRSWKSIFYGKERFGDDQLERVVRDAFASHYRRTDFRAS